MSGTATKDGCVLGARGVGGPSATKLGNGALRTWPQCKNHALRRNLNNVRTVSLSAHAQRLILKYFYLGDRVFDEGRLTSFGQKVCRCVAPLTSSGRVGKILKGGKSHQEGKETNLHHFVAGQALIL